MEPTYPLIEPADRGFRVRTGPGAYLPGIYLKYLLAQKALARHLGSMIEARQGKKRKQGE